MTTPTPPNIPVRVVMTQSTPVTRDRRIEQFGPRSRRSRPLFGNRLRWAKGVIAETLEQRRAG